MGTVAKQNIIFDVYEEQRDALLRYARSFIQKSIGWDEVFSEKITDDLLTYFIKYKKTPEEHLSKKKEIKRALWGYFKKMLKSNWKRLNYENISPLSVTEKLRQFDLCRAIINSNRTNGQKIIL